MAEGTAPSSANLQPLCYEHHVLMRPVRILIKGEMYPAPTLAYTCPEPSCLIHYSSPSGYFMTPMPDVTCPNDSLPCTWPRLNRKTEVSGCGDVHNVTQPIRMRRVCRDCNQLEK